jgi:ABC-2 type transport system ATP-binding protein
MVCDRVAILNRGKLLKTGHLSELLSAGHVEVTASEIDDVTVGKLKEYVDKVEKAEGYCIISQSEGECVNKTIDLIRQCNGRVVSIIPQRRTLEELFVEMIREVNK